MEKVIYLPNAEQAGRLIEDAWQDFCRQAGENGMDIADVNEAVGGLVKDCFAAGYSYGNNDMLNIIRDQMNVDGMVSELMNG